MLLLLVGLSLIASPALAGDWPQWRYDAGRTAASPDDLPADLKLSWVRKYTPREQVWDDPLNHDLMPYDRVFEPVIVGRRLIVPFNDRDKVVALDIDSGRELWTFYCDGPVRLPPAAFKEKLYVASDDGWLYCLNVADGAVVWKFRGAPGARKALGNKRVISSWPARGGPVVRDGKVYFAASIWPMMGTFIYALDAETGKVQWVNDGTGAQFILQPHGSPSFAGVGPQGALVATEKLLLIPGGRSAPAAYERSNGQFQYFHFVQKGIGGSFVCADEKNYYVHTRYRETAVCDLASGKPSKKGRVQEPVLFDGGKAMVEGEKISVAAGKFAFNVPADGSGDLIRAGSRIYAAGKKQITALDTEGKAVWSQPVEGEVLRLLAGADRLVAVTLDGRIMVFGPQAGSAEPVAEAVTPAAPPAETSAKAKELIARGGAKDGYALWFGIDDPALLQAVVGESKLHIVAVDPDAAKVAPLRKQFDAAGLYGKRVAIHQGDAKSFAAPPYIASMVVVGRSMAAECAKPEVLAAMFESVRPYGSALAICDAPADLAAAIEAAKMPQARVAAPGKDLMVFRDGSLPGAADWTHQYGDIANTVKSNDRRVKLPLGVLWFGGSSNLDVLPRHGHGPPQQVIGGRLFIEGMDCLSARDVYTGRVLWKRTIEGLDNDGVYFDDSYKDTPLSTAYNQKHIPGANGRGTNYVATEKEVYLVLGSRCEVLDAATGETMRKIEMPKGEGQVAPPLWGFIGVYGDILLGGAGFAHYSEQPADLASRKNLGILNLSASDGLVAFDRHTGKVLWRVKSDCSFIHNGIVAGGGKVYCLDRLPTSIEGGIKRRGQKPPAYRILVLDSKTGSELWRQQKDIFGTWLGYSEKHDLLLQAGAHNSDRLADEVDKGMVAYDAKNGKVLWQDLTRAYAGPCILHNDTILTNVPSKGTSSGAYSLIDGAPVLLANPLTGRNEPMQVTRKYGCNSVVASENLLTFRSGAAGFYDLAGHGGTGNFGGFKSSCTSNLVVAGGILNAPDYTRTCSCSYQNQTSLGLVHMPENEMWTYNRYNQLEGRIRQLGVNFGAAGDRRSGSGTMWLEWPSVGGDSPAVAIEVKPDTAPYYRRHAAGYSGELPWVASSWVGDVESVTINLNYGDPAKNAAAKESSKYTLRLFFAEPEDIQPGQRVFDVQVADRPPIENLDIVKEAGGPRRGIVREIKGVVAQDKVTILLKSKSAAPYGALLCGVELIPEP
ncbi:MAG: PQQ-binding-like beta-propeller repeat protein [Planctomycetes bacterium]|nr:PQQ-binding-like beta-propeller repeat protein [Planctomycetota bacterium]